MANIKDIATTQTTALGTDWIEIETADGISKKEQLSVISTYGATLRSTLALMNDINPVAAYQVTGASMATPFANAIALNATHVIAVICGAGGSGGGGILSYGGGGGGAGVCLITPLLKISDFAGDYVCTCGVGGAAATNLIGNAGGSTFMNKFATIIASGGSGGVKGVSTGAAGGNGGGYGTLYGAGGTTGAVGQVSFRPAGAGGSGSAGANGGSGGGSGFCAGGGQYAAGGCLGGLAGLYGYAGGKGGVAALATGTAGGLGAGGGGSLGVAAASGKGGDGYINLYFW